MIDKIIKNDNLVVNTDVEKVDGDELEFAIVFNIDEERMFYLNNTSYEILKFAETQISIDDIIEHFKKIYSIAADEIESIKQAIFDMVEKNILLIVDNECLADNG